MTQYIDKAAVVAEIRRIMAEEMSFFKDCCNDELENTSSPAVYTRMEMLLSFLGTIEVKEVENTELLKVRGYLVRDKDDYTAIYAEKPHRGKTEWVKGNDSCLMTINDARLVPDIEFEDEPVEVEVTLKRVQIK